MGDDNSGGGFFEALGSLVVGGVIAIGGIALLAAMSEERNRLVPASAEPDPDERPKMSEEEMREAVRRLAQIRKDDPAEWAREVSRDAVLTELVLNWQGREKRVFQAETDLRNTVNPRPPKPETKGPKREWFEEMHEKEERVRVLYPDPVDHEPIIEMIRRQYMEGEA
jgi:hypothetical protein